MPEYFVVTNSFAAPFVSDTDVRFIVADDPASALTEVVNTYRHPAGLYSAAVYPDANAKHKGDEPLLMWLSNQAIAVLEETKGLSVYSYLGKGPGASVVDVNDPKGGRIV
jgi:hypothetical protein